jgi:magnesium-transporting ATPase (P-type)
MSVIVEAYENFHGNNHYYLITKGADSSMLPLLINESENFIVQIKQVLYRYACEGLRTLVYGKRSISEVY